MLTLLCGNPYKCVSKYNSSNLKLIVNFIAAHPKSHLNLTEENYQVI